MASKEWMTDKEVAERLGVDRLTPWRWVREGLNGFPAPVRLSAKITRWSYLEILAWEANQRAGGTRAA